MPEISFYVLASKSTAERNLFACKLIEKAYRSGIFPYVLTDSAEQSQQFDDLLWTFRAGSFIPHEIYQEASSGATPRVLIGSGQAPQGWQNTIINLSLECPSSFEDAGRILEILDDNDELKKHGRKRYRQYQQAGFEPLTHKITAA